MRVGKTEEGNNLTVELYNSKNDNARWLILFKIFVRLINYLNYSTTPENYCEKNKLKTKGTNAESLKILKIFCLGR